MLAQLSSKQVAEWLAFNSIEPIGEVRGDLRAGIVASVIANVNKKRGAKAAEPKDFMPDFDRGYKDGEPIDKEESIYNALMALAKQQDIKAEKQQKKKKKIKESGEHLKKG